MGVVVPPSQTKWSFDAMTTFIERWKRERV
jgi:hypothetical protein